MRHVLRKISRDCEYGYAAGNIRRTHLRRNSEIGGLNLLETIIYGLIISIFVGISAGYLGSLMVLEKMALVGDALSHVALPGLAIGYLLNFNPFIGGHNDNSGDRIG